MRCRADLDAVADGQIGVRVAGPGLGELLAEGVQGTAAARCGGRVEPDVQRAPTRGSGSNRSRDGATASSLLNTAWHAWEGQSARSERVVGVGGPLAGFSTPVLFVLPGVPGPLQLRGG